MALASARPFRLLIITPRIALALLSTPLVAQGPPQRDTTPPINQADDPALRGFRWRVIGPIGQ